ncbi:MAG: hypothetical protein GX357_08885 [Firmicutes bacterium]|nr:hypothetical protein [Bacillota bacterium]
MPSWELFKAQPAAYRQQVLPDNVKKRIAIEAGHSLGWQQFTGDEGLIISIDQFGASAPGEVLLQEFGFTAENIVQKAVELLARS